MTLISQALANSDQIPAQPGALAGLMPIFLIFIIFYLLILRPQQKRVKQHNALLSTIKKGDVVLTSGGIKGVVREAKEDNITIEIAKNVQIQILRSTISNKLEEKFTPIESKESKPAKKRK